MSYIVVLDDGETFSNLQGCMIYEVIDEDGFDEVDWDIKDARSCDYIKPVELVNVHTK